MICSAAVALVLLSGPARGAELREAPRPGQEPGLIPRTASDQFGGLLILNEKLKNAVCDENFVSRAPTLESISENGAVEAPSFNYELRLPESSFSEAEALSFLLGDALTFIQSAYVRDELREGLKKKGLEMTLDQPVARMPLSGALAGAGLNDAQSLVTTIKRKVSLAVCEGLVDNTRFKAAMTAIPSRFIEVMRGRQREAWSIGQGAGAVAAGKLAEGAKNLFIEVRDREARFGWIRNGLARGETELRYLVAGWIEPFEVEGIRVRSKTSERLYRRRYHPLTNNTTGVEVRSQADVPLGVLFLSRDPAGRDWTAYRAVAESKDTRARQAESYRQQIEFSALKALARQGADRAGIRDLQEFYKNLIQAYQLFPDERQFESYAKKNLKRMSLDEICDHVLGKEFLDALARARVNGSYVNFALFKPDTKLQAIYNEFSARLAKLSVEQ